MRHYCAQQQTQTGKWDYCCGDQPVGYCAGFPSAECTVLPPEVWQSYLAECEPFRDKYHTAGHDTEEEACDCYLEYLLDRECREWESSSEQRKCRECGTWTTHMVQVGQCWMENLCSEHATRELIKKHYGSVGEMWIS